MSVRSVSSMYWYVPLQYGYRLPVFECGCQLFQVTVRVVDLERPKCDFASGSPYRNCAFALRHIDTDGGNNSSFHFPTSFNAGSAYVHYRFSLLCDTNVRQHFYLPITQPASIERCNGDGGEQFARTSVQLKQCFVLSAHPHCSLGLGICIAHWL